MTTQDTLEHSVRLLDYLGIGSPQDLLETLLLVAGAGITGFVVSEILVYLWELRLSLSSDFAGFREKLESRVALIKRFGERHSQLGASVDAVDEQIKEMTTRQSTLTGRLRQIQDMQSRCVRTIGHPAKGSKLFRALVTNSYVREYVAAGNSHPVYDDSWARAQIVEVWASSNAFALLVLREKYPQGQGFAVDKIEQVENESGKAN